MATGSLKNKRLSQHNRDTLYSFAKKQVAATADTTALDTAYEAAAQSIHDVMVAKYPPKDMKVLARYDAASPDECIYVSTLNNRFEQFCFRKEDARIPMRPGRVGNCNRRNALLLEGPAEAAYDTFYDAQKAHEAAIKLRLKDFNALIYNAQTFNEVASVWPAAEALRTTIVGSATALTVLSGDVVERIKNDAALTLVEAA
ncbi:MAG: hypothetical protein ACOYBT_10055 [Polynucleobacter sp.]